MGKVLTLEEYLIKELGESELKNIGEEIAGVIRNHHLQNHPDIFEVLLEYVSSVIKEWNIGNG